MKKDCWRDCPKIKFEKGDVVQTSKEYRRHFDEYYSGTIVEVEYRKDAAPLISFCENGTVKELDQGWLEHVKDCCPGIIKRELKASCCCCCCK